MSIKFVLNETSYFGKNSRENLVEEITKRNFKKVFLVSDKALVEAGVTGKVEEILSNANIAYSLYDDIKEVVCFNLFQIGELANGLSVEFIKEYNKIPWKQIIGMRNRIVHGYDTINLEIVWNTAIESIPELKEYCKEILK